MNPAFWYNFILCDGNSSSNQGNFIIATGGTITDVGNRRYHFFEDATQLETFSISYVPTLYNNTILFSAIAGGGGQGGASNGGSGGGAGGLIDNVELRVTPGIYDVSVGYGGSGGTHDNSNTGKSTTIFNYKAFGGGRGLAGGGANISFRSGGSGAGATRNDPAGSGISGQGNSGGYGIGSGWFPTGGGGGAGAAGGNGSGSVSGSGGAGKNIDYMGVVRQICAGGGGGCTDNAGTPGSGGAGGGGNGSGNNNGSAATDYGGGGGGAAGPGKLGGAGYKGLVILSYIFQNDLIAPSADALDYRSYFETWTNIYSRWDASCAIQRQDGTYIMGVNRYYGNPGDAQPASIVFYSSTNCKSGWTYLSTITSGTWAAYTPNLAIKSNGDIVCVWQDWLTSTTTRIVQQISTDGGVTWGSIQVLRYNVGERVSFTGRPIFVTNSGRWLMTYYKYISGPPDTGNYNSGILYSDDEGDSWTEGPSLIAISLLCVEGGFVYKPDGNIAFYFRNRNGYIGGFDTSDEGETFGAEYNITAGIDSQSVILKLSNGTYILARNESNRTLLYLYKSTDFTTWNFAKVMESNINLNFIEPSAIELGGTIGIFYSQSNSPVEFWDFKQFHYPMSLL